MQRGVHLCFVISCPHVQSLLCAQEQFLVGLRAPTLCWCNVTFLVTFRGLLPGHKKQGGSRLLRLLKWDLYQEYFYGTVVNHFILLNPSSSFIKDNLSLDLSAYSRLLNLYLLVYNLSLFQYQVVFIIMALFYSMI